MILPIQSITILHTSGNIREFQRDGLNIPAPNCFLGNLSFLWGLLRLRLAGDNPDPLGHGRYFSLKSDIG